MFLPFAAALAQDGSGADLLDVSRRAAVVDQVLAEHLDRMSAARIIGTNQRFRLGTNTSFYLVSRLSLETPDEGPVDVQLSRSYVGFLVDLLAKPGGDGTPGEQVVYFTGGGIAYGLSRPFVLPLPEPTGTTTGTGLPTTSKNDLTGTQYSDEQYALGGRWKGFLAEGSWARGQQLESTADGRAAVDTIEQRLNRAQLLLDSPYGLRVSTRIAIGGAVENVTVGFRVNDLVEETAAPDPEAFRKLPVLALGFRKSDYAGADERSHPRVVGAGLSEDFRWLFGPIDPSRGAWTARARTQVDLDLAAPRLQLALGEAELGWFGRGEVAGHLGGSTFQDAGLVDVIGRTSVSGVQGGGHLGFAFKAPECGEGGVDEDGSVCAPNLGLRGALSFSYRQSWAEELRFVSEFAGKPQSYFYLELMGGA